MYLLRLDPHLPWQPVAIEAAKRAVYDGFRSATQDGPPRASGIVVDERSTLILRDAISYGYTTVCTVGAIGNRDFDNQVEDETTVHPSASQASYWRVVVRFNPAEQETLTPLQLARLRRLSDSLERRPGGPQLMCDLVVPPTQWQLVRGIRAFDREVLPELTAIAILRLVGAGITPALWVIEGFEHRTDYEQVMTAVTQETPAGCLVRAAGHSDVTTFDLMRVGLSSPGVVGVVLGPAPFWDPVAAWMLGRTTRARAVASVEEHFRSWATRLEASRMGLTQQHEEQV